MAKKLVHEFVQVMPQRQRLFIDGVCSRIVFFGTPTVPSPNVYFDGQIAVFSGSESPTVYDWPAIRDSAGELVRYDTFLDITTDSGSHDPIGMLHTIREVER